MFIETKIVFSLVQHILMLKKRRPSYALYKVRLICKVIRRSLTGQRYVDEVLHPHVMQIYQTVGNNFRFQEDNSSIPAIWQGNVCRLVMSNPLDWPIWIHLRSAIPGIFMAGAYMIVSLSSYRLSRIRTLAG